VTRLYWTPAYLYKLRNPEAGGGRFSPLNFLRLFPGYLQAHNNSAGKKGKNHDSMHRASRCVLPAFAYSELCNPHSVLKSASRISVATFSYLLVQPLAGHLADKIDIAKTVFVGLLLAALVFSTVRFTAPVPLIAVVIIAGVGIGTVLTNSNALVSTLATRGQLGASIGAAQSFKEFGDMVGPLLVGLITQLFGVRAGFVSCCAVALACLVWLISGGFAARKN